MRRDRPGFTFEIALVAIIAIIGTILVLIFILVNSYNVTEESQIGVVEVSESEIKAKDINSYVDKLEHYREGSEVLSNKAVTQEIDVNIIARDSELSDHSLVKVIDNIVESSLRGE